MIGHATPKGATRITEIWNSVIRDTSATFTMVEKSVGAVTKTMTRQPFFVSCSATTVTGFATHTPFRSGPDYAHTMEHSVHLDADAQRKGTGRALMARLKGHAKFAGIHSLLAGICGENTAGIAFHSALGYAQTA